MPEIMWQPNGPTNHTIPDEWYDLPLDTIVKCDCGKFVIFGVDDYGVPEWQHLSPWRVLAYRIFMPTRIGRAAHRIPIVRRGDQA